MADNFAAELLSGSARLGMTLSAGAIDSLVAFLLVLSKWNRTFNLTAIREPSKLVSHHLLDSLAIIRYLQPGSVIDVGTGAGLPGLPIAIAEPHREIQLLDSNHKKVTFLRQAVLELGLANVSVIDKRVEDYHPPKKFQNVVSRAFSDLHDFAALAGHLCDDEGRLLAMKGLHPHEEIALLPDNWVAEHIFSLDVPQLGATRHLVVMQSTSVQVGAH
jgi:16S rRNA (guanine527-N7)-methyltransferase